nr:transposase [Yersinia enterocolitica]
MTATYLVASVGNGQQFHSAKQFAAWLGLGAERVLKWR